MDAFVGCDFVVVVVVVVVVAAGAGAAFVGKYLLWAAAAGAGDGAGAVAVAAAGVVEAAAVVAAVDGVGTAEEVLLYWQALDGVRCGEVRTSLVSSSARPRRPSRHHDEPA